MNVRTLLVVAAMAALPDSASAAEPALVDTGRSQVRFAFRQMNVPVEGRFRDFRATVAFDPARPGETKAAFEVDLASIDLGSPEGETEARRKPWLDVTAFPKARFEATEVKATGPGRFVATGPLTIKGSSRTISAPFTLADAGGLRVVEGQFPIRRLAYRIGEGAWSDTDTVADEVVVRFKFVIPLKP